MESKIPENDNMQISKTSNSELKKIIETESLLFSDNILKINRLGIRQERMIVLTKKALYNIKNKTVIRRRTELKSIIGITATENTDEFIIHCAELDHDYDYVSQNKIKIIQILAESYKAETQQDLPFVKTDAKSIKNYVTAKGDKKKDKFHSKFNKNNLYNINTYIEECSIDNDPPKPKKRSNTIFSKHRSVTEVRLEDFKILKVIGRGSYGKVCLVEYIPTKELYAMKSLKKDVLLDEDQVQSTLLEKKILETIEHPFLVGMVWCFQTEERIYFVMPFIRGGELFQHLKKERIFDEDKVRLYAAMIGLGLGHIHQHGIVYRDIKPENILMDEIGYLKIADFGMAKILTGDEKANSFCGTPEYLSPEVILGTGHDRTADWWSYGILIFEMLFGLPPFYCENNEKMYQYIIHADLKFPKRIHISDECKDFISKLLIKNKDERLGSKNDFDEIKAHPWFKCINFDDLLNRNIPAPFKPALADQMDVTNFDTEFTSEEVSTSVIPEKNMELIKENQDKFIEFDHK